MLHFREELEELKSKLLEMGGMVESAIHNSIYALVERDEERAKEVMWKEAQVNQREMEIDDLATRMLALFQPMARDLRFITAVIKMNADLERMGDLAVNITERALSLMQRAHLAAAGGYSENRRIGREHGTPRPGRLCARRRRDGARRPAGRR